MKDTQRRKANTGLLKQESAIILFFSMLFIGLFMINLITFQSYQSSKIETIVPLDSFVFLLMGSIFLGISCFSFLQLYRYKTGRLFAAF